MADTERFFIRNDINVDDRLAFQAAAIVAIATKPSGIRCDCSAVDAGSPVDDPVVGMLVAVGRTARRHGATVTLVGAPAPMRAQFETLGVDHFFMWTR
jgi:anti-anti-sigma regulatory factor